jgi:hypothetical protein
MATQSRVGWKPYVNLNTATYLLDTYGGAAAAYSLRKINSAYSGSVIRVRRSGDNVERDIPFGANGDLDTNTLLDFVGYTNLFTAPNNLADAGWGANGITKTANLTNDFPTGSTSSNKITETATNAQHFLSYSIITGTIDTQNVSAYLKKGTGSAAPDRIAISVGNATYGMYAIFNLSTGAIETQVPGTATSFQVAMTSVGNGWYRCSVGGKLNYTTNQNIRTSVQFCNNSASYNPFTTSYMGNVNADVLVANLQWLREAGLQRYGISGNGSGYVTTWYDQSGNGINRTSTTAANQPAMVLSGLLQTANGKPAMYFDGTNDQFIQQTPTFGDTTQGAGLNSTIFSVTKLDTAYITTSEYPIFGGLSNNGTRFAVRSNKWYLINNGSGMSSVGNVTTNQAISSVLFAPIDKVRINGSEVISGNVGTGGADSFIGRSWMGSFYKGYFQEHIIYTVDKSASFSSIESGINAYYAAY